MKTDTYTKVMLTIIAIFLGIIVVKDFDPVPKAYAGAYEREMRNAMSLCWDQANIVRVTSDRLSIRLAC